MSMESTVFDFSIYVFFWAKRQHTFWFKYSNNLRILKIMRVCSPKSNSIFAFWSVENGIANVNSMFIQQNEENSFHFYLFFEILHKNHVKITCDESHFESNFDRLVLDLI